MVPRCLTLFILSHSRLAHLGSCLAAILTLWVSSAPAALTIEIDPGSGLAGNTDALAAFNRAAAEWSSRIANDVTVYISADLVSMGSPTIIGATSFTSYTQDGSDINLNYDLVRDAMAARAIRPGDAILSSLPTSTEVQAQVPLGGTFDNTTLGTLRANQRVLGLLASTDIRADAIIQFNSNFAFDYDSSNGVGAGLIDFQTAAAHEIGHALGFLSDVDDFDTGSTTDNLTTMDLFRFATGSAPTTASDFTTATRVLTPGTPSVFSDTQITYNMSTGANLGDGNQAGHWKDDEQTGTLIGIMDPTLDYGTIETVQESDLRVMELLGYDIIAVPEPSVGHLLLLGVGWRLAFLRRRPRPWQKSVEIA